MKTLLFALAAAIAMACSASRPCTVDCASDDMVITSSATNIVSVSDSCGQSAECFALACLSIELKPPPSGGVCHVTVRLITGTVETDADWGAPHTSECCGTQFANTPQLSIDADAGTD